MTAKKFLSGACAVLMGMTLAGCSTPNSHEPAELQDFKPAVRATVSWKADVGENSGYLAPAVTANAVYAAGDRGLFRFDRNNGQEVWRVKLGDAVSGGVGTDGNTVAVVTSRGEVRVFDAEGKELWKRKLSAESDVSPLVGQGLVLVYTADTRITAFDALSGDRLWHYQGQAPALTLQVFKQMAWAPAGILVGQANGRMLALDAKGKTVFDAVIGQSKGITEVERLTDVVGRPWVDRELMCAATYQGQLVCMGSTDGHLAWTAQVDAVTGPISDNDRFYIVDASGRVHAYNRQNGREEWVNSDLLWRSTCAPARVGGALAVADFEGYVTMLNPATGEVIGRTDLDSAVRSQAAQLDFGAVYQTVDGKVALVLQEPLTD